MMSSTLMRAALLFALISFTFELYNDNFDEKLLIKPLPNGQVYSEFKFVVEQEIDASSGLFSVKHFRLFPRSFGEVVAKHSVQELHLSLTQGRWQYEKWGYPFRDSPSGVELWAWFKPSTLDVDSSWRDLASVLSGQFCASFNFINQANTITPTWSFRPEGVVPDELTRNSSFLRYATLPSEIVCTENLTPFKKLLPCESKAGLSTLLNSMQLFGAHYMSLAVDYKTICRDRDCKSLAVQLVQSVSVVFDTALQQKEKPDWSLIQLFGSGLIGSCPVSSNAAVFVDISSNKTGVPFSLVPRAMELIKGDVEVGGQTVEYAMYNLKKIFRESRPINIAASYKGPHIYWLIPPPVLYANRYLIGYGQEHGGIQCVIHNHHNKPVKVLYMDVIPWFMRSYFHTLKIKTKNEVIKPEYSHYVPAKDRERPHHLEVIFTMPPSSQVEVTIDFDYAFLKWTEYAPDAHHGFYAGPSTLSVLLDDNKNFTYFPRETLLRAQTSGHFIRMHTQILLVSLPTPDFSMPYNVICLSCTVVALAFGPAHNLTTRCLSYIEEKDEDEGAEGNKWLKLISSKAKKLKAKLWKTKEVVDAVTSKKDQ